MVTGDGNNYTTSPNMGLKMPTPGVCGPLGVEPPGASWLELQNASALTLDSHNHSSGLGAQIPASALAINADVSWGANNITALRSVRFSAFSLGTVGALDIGSLLVSSYSGDLYYVDLSGNQIRMTNGGSIAGSAGSISGMSGAVAVAYSAASGAFTFSKSAVRQAAIGCGPLSISDASVDSGKSVTLKAVAGLGSSFQLTLPTSLPSGTSFMQLDSSGVISSGPLVSGGLTAANLSPTAGIYRSQLASVGQQISATTGVYGLTSATPVFVGNLLITITTTGRPVVIVLISDGGAPQIGGPASTFILKRNGTSIATWSFNTGAGVAYSFQPFHIDPVAAGTYTYTIYAYGDGVNSTFIEYVKLAAYEL